jgi:hypothetical protein
LGHAPDSVTDIIESRAYATLADAVGNVLDAAHANGHGS